MGGGKRYIQQLRDIYAVSSEMCHWFTCSPGIHVVYESRVSVSPITGETVMENFLSSFFSVDTE